MADIDIGDIYRVTISFVDENSAAADPTAVTFRFRKPDGTRTAYVYVTDPEVVKSSTGVYYVDLSLDQAGVWTWRFEGVGGSAASADEDNFTVESSVFY